MPVLSTWGAMSARGFGFGTNAPVPAALWAWGSNFRGQLGLGNTTDYSSPKQVGALLTWSTVYTSITPGDRNLSVVANKIDGTLWSWGYNSVGQLGLGNTTSYSSPKQIGANTNWASFILGTRFCIATKTDGTLWSWGGSGSGSLGLGNTTPYSSPKQVGALTNWSKVNASGNYASFGIKTDGTLWAWGLNNSGALGLGNLTSYSSPKQVGSLANWASIVSIQFATLAVKTDGTLWAWGGNSVGQLGLGNTTGYSSPKQVGALTNWSKVAASQQSSLAVKTDGTLWAWGYNNQGQLGLGNVTFYSSPVQVGALTNWKTPLRGSVTGAGLGNGGTSGAIKADGTLWLWGPNPNGQLGLSNTTDYSSPKQVGVLTWKSAATGVTTLAIRG